MIATPIPEVGRAQTLQRVYSIDSRIISSKPLAVTVLKLCAIKDKKCEMVPFLRSYILYQIFIDVHCMWLCEECCGCLLCLVLDIPLSCPDNTLSTPGGASKRLCPSWKPIGL